MTKKVYSIGDFSRVSGFPITTLRYYDEKRILVPEIKDPVSNYRYYSENQLMEAFYILHLKNLGITSLSHIEYLIRRKRLQDMRDSLQIRLNQLQAEINRMESQYQDVQRVYDLLAHMVPAQSENLAESIESGIIGLRYYCRRKIIQQEMITHFYSSKQFYQSYVELSKLCEREKLIDDGILSMVFIDHTLSRFDGRDYRGMLFFSVDETKNKFPGMQEFGGFWVYSAVHIGHYRDLPALYHSLTQRIMAEKLEIIGDPIEEYLLYFSLTINENQFTTRVSFPVKPPRVR